MKVLLIVSLLGTAYCSESLSKEEIKPEGRRITGGGNYGGFIGLTTYGGGPFLVKGKYESDSYGEVSNTKDIKKDDDGYEPKLVGNVGYEDIQRDEPNNGGINNEKKDDEYIEYLGYRGPRGYCIGEYRDKYEFGNSPYGIGPNQRNTNFSNYFDQEINDRCDKLFGFTGPTANDEPENLIRPCALDDWQCIRQYFAANSNCKPAYGPIPDPLYLDVNTIFLPTVNLTISLPNLMVRGLSSAKISDFYVNKFSGNLVLALNLKDLNETLPRAYFRFRRTAKESIVLADYASIQYASVVMTAVIPNIPHLRLDLADIHPDSQDIPRLIVGPGNFNSTDPDVVSAFTEFNLRLPTIIREGLVFQAQLLTAIYIQKNICDFGLQIISV